MACEARNRVARENLSPETGSPGVYPESGREEEAVGNPDGPRQGGANSGGSLLLPIFEADFHENSFAYRPKRRAQQAIDAIKIALLSGRREVVDADLSGYFDTIPHAGLMRLVKGRVSDGSILKLIKGWLRSPIVEEDPETGVKRTVKNRCGTTQGGVIWLLRSRSVWLRPAYLARLPAARFTVTGQPLSRRLGQSRQRGQANESGDGPICRRLCCPLS